MNSIIMIQFEMDTDTKCYFQSDSIMTLGHYIDDLKPHLKIVISQTHPNHWSVCVNTFIY